MHDPVVKPWEAPLVPQGVNTRDTNIVLRSTYGETLLSTDVNMHTFGNSSPLLLTENISNIPERVANFLSDLGYSVKVDSEAVADIEIILNKIDMGLDDYNNFHSANLKISFKVIDNNKLVEFEYDFSREMGSNVGFSNYFAEKMVVNTLNDAILQALLQTNME